jgi:hypothetical protein
VVYTGCLTWVLIVSWSSFSGEKPYADPGTAIIIKEIKTMEDLKKRNGNLISEFKLFMKSEFAKVRNNRIFISDYPG